MHFCLLYIIFFCLFTGQHLRSIEEPTHPAQLFSLNSNSHNSLGGVYGGGVGGSGRMPTELGGTGYGSEQNLLLSNRTGVPLATYQQHQYQQHQNSLLQQQQQQQQTPSSPYYNYPSTTSASFILHPLSPQRHYDPEYARMEAWMDENQEFVQDYFIR